MTLATKLQAYAVRVGTEFKTIRSSIGTLASLTTTEKASIVAAINEVKAGQAQAGAQINDTTPGTGTVYSSSKTNTQIADARAALKTEILGGAAAAQDTLLELKQYADALDQVNDAEAASMLAAIGNRLRFDAAQTLTTGQKAQGNTNLGSASLVNTGDLEQDLVAVFEAALA